MLEKKKRKVITSYVNPDMDGIGSMYAYSELLRKEGENAEFYIEGKPKKEVSIVLEKFGISFEQTKEIRIDDDIIVVDNNELNFMPKCVLKNQIIEVIDHHQKREWLENNNSVKCQIELIGAAATLIVERFKKYNITPSREASILMYYGIISNTMNLKIKMTTDRDREAAKWLKELVPEINDELTKEIFIEKSQIGDNIEDEMEVGFMNPFVKIKWSIGQLEVVNADEFLEKYEEKIRAILERVGKKNGIDYISTNVMDVLNGYNIIIAGNKGTAELISENFNNLKFNNLKAISKDFMSRKEIVKVISDRYKKE